MLGTELIPKIRALGFAGKVIIKSAKDSAEDIARFREAGADTAISKDLSGKALMRAIARICHDEA